MDCKSPAKTSKNVWKGKELRLVNSNNNNNNNNNNNINNNNDNNNNIYDNNFC